MWFRLAALVGLAWQTAGAADLVIQRVALHDYQDGPLIAPGYEYLPGETVWLSVRVAGFQRDAQAQDSALDRVHLTWQLRPADPAGSLLVPPLRGVVDETLRPEDKAWTPKIVVSFELPAFLPRGTYRVPVTLRDDLAKTEVAAQLEFRVRGEEAPAVDTAFGLRNFRFLAKEDDRFPLRPAVFKPGAPLFARFDIVGYTFEGNNHFAVEYGLAFLGPDGAKKLFVQDTAAAEAGESFYPQRWIPAAFGLNLDPDIPLGEHTLVLTLRDKVAGNLREFRESFTVR